MTNEIVLSTKLIPLSKNGKKHKGKYFSIVDYWMYDWLMQWNWAYNNGYAIKTCWTGIKQFRIRMHVFVYGLSHPDHINLNRLDNRWTNFRPVNHSQNAANHTKRKNTSSPYIGVYLDKKRNRFRAHIEIYGKVFKLGYYKCEQCAAYDRDVKAIELFGEYAKLNFPK